MRIPEKFKPCLLYTSLTDDCHVAIDAQEIFLRVDLLFLFDGCIVLVDVDIGKMEFTRLSQLYRIVIL